MLMFPAMGCCGKVGRCGEIRLSSWVVVDEGYGPVLVSLALGGCSCSWLAQPGAGWPSQGLAGCVGFNGMPQLYCWHLRKAQSRFGSAPQEICKLGHMLVHSWDRGVVGSEGHGKG